MENVADAATHKALLPLLPTPPDPTVRLALADNSKAPREALEAPCANADIDVARTARERRDRRKNLDRPDKDEGDFDD